MTNNLENGNMTTADTEVAAAETNTWQLNALTEALGDLSLTVSDSLSVGRGSDNDVVLGSKQVSRNHALLSVTNGKLYLKDLNSSNGTFINEERIESNKSEQVKADDTVGFASFSFQVLAPIANAFDTATSLEQPVEPINTDEVSTDLEPTHTDTLPNLVFEQAVSADVEDSETASVKNSTSIDSTVESDTAKDMTDASQTEEPVVKETIIAEVLSSTASNSNASAPAIADVESEPTINSASIPSTAAEQETVMSNDTSKEPASTEPLNNEPLNKETGVNEPVTSEPLVKEPTVHQEPAPHKQPIVTPEHDKTTKTALQEEADPDILRARQAATGQLTGTANLGRARDIGTEGNNAMDQAINNSANAGQVEPKSSGGWFIWVFVAIAIIGLALWLFNMGGA